MCWAKLGIPWEGPKLLFMHLTGIIKEFEGAVDHGSHGNVPGKTGYQLLFE